MTFDQAVRSALQARPSIVEFEIAVLLERVWRSTPTEARGCFADGRRAVLVIRKSRGELVALDELTAREVQGILRIQGMAA